MKAKILETCAGKTFRAQAGQIAVDNAYELNADTIFMKKTDIQSLINAGYALEIKEKKGK